jgi:membrane-associated protease RseP (regulator of RpoE activity)
MQTWQIVVLVVIAVLVAGVIALSIYGKKLQKKSEASQAELKAGAQTFSILVIDKKRMKLSEAGFPQIVLDQTPKYLRRAKVPVVKAKIGPKVASLMCDEKIFDLIPIKKEVKAVMNGIYIIDVKGMRGGLDAKPAKKNFFARIKDKVTKKS